MTPSSFCAGAVISHNVNLVPRAFSNFLLRMPDENEGTGSNSPQIADFIVLYCISDNQSGSPKNWSFPEPSFPSSMRRKKLAGSGNEIAVDS